MIEKMSLLNNPQKNAKEKLAQHYLSKYVRELQLHFNLKDSDVKKIILKVLNSINRRSGLNKFLDMIKFFR